MFRKISKNLATFYALCYNIVNMHRKEETRDMELLGKTLSEKIEKIYQEIEEKLSDPLNILVMDIENELDVNRPCYHDVKGKEYVIKLDVTMEDKLFENALVRNLIYCLQMEEGAPILEPNPKDQMAVTAASMINSTILDINLELRLKEYGVVLDEIDTMRLGDLFAFLRTDMAQRHREMYNIVTCLQVLLIYFTAEKKENIEQIIETFELSDPDLCELIDKGISIIEKYGCDTTRGQMRCMRKLALMLGMKDKIKVFYEGKATLV